MKVDKLTKYYDLADGLHEEITQAELNQVGSMSQEIHMLKHRFCVAVVLWITELKESDDPWEMLQKANPDPDMYVKCRTAMYS